MNWTDAINKMREGHKVRQPDWEPHEYLCIKGTAIMRSDNQAVPMMNLPDSLYRAQNFEIHKEDKK